MSEPAISPLRRRMIEDRSASSRRRPNVTMCKGQGVRELPQTIPRYSQTGRCTRLSAASDVERRRHAELIGACR